jgi:hypothetical protein
MSERAKIFHALDRVATVIGLFSLLKCNVITLLDNMVVNAIHNLVIWTKLPDFTLIITTTISLYQFYSRGKKRRPLAETSSRIFSLMFCNSLSCRGETEC